MHSKKILFAAACLISFVGPALSQKHADLGRVYGKTSMPLVRLGRVSSGAPAFEQQSETSFEKLRKISRKFEAESLSFPQISASTWSRLNTSTRQSLVSKYQKLAGKKEQSPLALQDVLTALSNKADLSAFRKLIDEGAVVDRRIGNELDLDVSPILQKSWIGIESEIGPQIPSTNKEQAALALYRNKYDKYNTWSAGGFDENEIYRPELNSPGVSARCGRDCAIVSPGTPNPQLPGATLAPVEWPKRAVAIDESSSALAVRRTRSFNPTGFLEVVKILMDDSEVSCTGTLISPAIVLSAAHCVQGKASTSLKVRIGVLRESDMLACIDVLKSGGMYIRCVGQTTVRVKEVKIHDAFDPKLHKNDVAYLVLADAVPDAKTAKVEFPKTMPEFITLAGYGNNGSKGPRPLVSQFAIEVGWHKGGAISAQDDRIEWLYSDPMTQSATCSGDSGGPIYLGDYDGGVDAGAHSIFAIVTSGKSASCQNFYVTQTRLSSPQIRSWLCAAENLRTAINACAQVISEVSTPMLLAKEQDEPSR